MNDQLLRDTITIESIESKMFDDSTQYTVLAGNKKYKFYDKKKDGTPTKAFQTFDGLKRGSTVEIMFKEEEKDYQGKAYTARSIMAFGRINSIQQEIPVVAPNQVSGELSKLKEDILKLTGRVKSLEIILNAKQSIVPDNYIAPVTDEPLTVGGEVVPF